ncbi:MAG: hypothetical protein PHD02_01600 [Bacilli bacterium]|nr:hypothetical protein [Bacilli bacterium]
MNGQFLIPANSKKSMLIFGIFNPFDLILFSIGIFLTLLMLIALPLQQIPILVLALTPLLLSAFLIFPVANYHNVLTVLILMYKFFTERQKFIWKGWCASYESKDNNTSKK